MQILKLCYKLIFFSFISKQKIYFDLKIEQFLKKLFWIFPNNFGFDISVFLTRKEDLKDNFQQKLTTVPI